MSTTPPDSRSRGRASVPDDFGTPDADAVRGRASVPHSGGGGSVYTSTRGSTYRRKRIRPRWGRIALVVGLAVVLLGGIAAAAAGLYYRQLNAGMHRVDPFSSMDANRPGKEVEGALNVLLLGSDSRDPDNNGKAGEWRTDTMIILHIPASHDKAYLISIPRDLYVYVPKSQTNPKFGNTKAKINAAFAWGGLPLAIQTIEEFTEVRMDHVVLIDFGGFKQVTDALGGVDMYIEQNVKSIHPPYRQFKKGMNHLNGAEALDYVRQRYQFADGDFSRMRHQQQFLKALLDKAASSGTLTNLGKLNAFLKAVTASMTVDKDFSLIDTGLQFRNIRSSDLTFMVSPNKGSDMVNGESVVVSDKEKASALYQAVKSDTAADWVARYGPSASPNTVASSRSTR